jgi:hypothetical protein
MRSQQKQKQKTVPTAVYLRHGDEPIAPPAGRDNTTEKHGVDRNAARHAHEASNGDHVVASNISKNIW